MDASMAGAALAVLAGVAMGLSAAPIKFMTKFRYEHWTFINSFLSLIVLPWCLAVALCPDLSAALRHLPISTYLKANLWSLAWGVANILCGLCFVRIGVSLTTGLLTGIGLPVGILLPMVFKGSGQFATAPSLFSSTGLTLQALTLVLVFSVALMARAGSEREQKRCETRGSFKVGLLMAIAAGFLQVGLSFAFVYSQGPLMAALTQRGASESGAICAVWAVTLPGGALINVLFPLSLMLHRRTLATLSTPKDFCLTLLMPLLFVCSLLGMANGMRMMGALGASLGFGLQQGLQILTAQGVGILTGEWKGVLRQTQVLMISAVVLMLIAISAMAFMQAK